MIKIIAEDTGKSYLPDMYAYKSYFEKQEGFSFAIVPYGEEVLNCDIYLKFTGLAPFWKKKNIKYWHEYQSCSTGSYPRGKDAIKKMLNAQPCFRTFLNEFVRSRYSFNDKVPHEIRDMGIDVAFFDPDYRLCKKSYDIVYAGSFNGRHGLIQAIKKLASNGFSILIIGDVQLEVMSTLRAAGRVNFTGRLSRKDMPAAISQAKYGLNYIPEIYPYTEQTSTKVLEYCALSMGVITNRYSWINSFESDRGGNFLDIELAVSQYQNITHEFNFIVPDVSDLEWNSVIDRANIKSSLKNILQGN
jgi:glycosyltransferase involved in cell wall biosynthesis